MENKDGMMCDCCGWGNKGFHQHKMAVLRWLLGIIILYVTFHLGVKIGEFKQEIKSQWSSPYQMMQGDYRSQMMRGGYGGYGGYGMNSYGMPMMGNYYSPKSVQPPAAGDAAGN